MNNARIKAVKEFLQLSIANEVDLQDIVYLASEICSTPIASITFVDNEKQHPVLGKGTVVESSSDIAFCSHTIMQETVLEVPDATLDDRFFNNPLVTEDPCIRFYAGAPLKTTDGHTIGSLCVIDHQAKKLTEGQLKSLEILAKQVMHRLEIHLNTQRIKDSLLEVEQNRELLEHASIMKDIFFDSSEGYFLLLNPKLEIVTCNQKTADFFNKRTGRTDFGAGKRFLDYVSPSLLERLSHIFDECLNGSIEQHEILVDADSPNNFWIRFTISPAYNSKMELIGIAGIASNIQKEKTQEEKIRLQNSVLTQIAQIHAHEIRHPLTNILGIINLIKQDGVSKQYVEYLETAAKELDAVIHKVVLDSYEGR